MSDQSDIGPIVRWRNGPVVRSRTSNVSSGAGSAIHVSLGSSWASERSSGRMSESAKYEAMLAQLENEYQEKATMLKNRILQLKTHETQDLARERFDQQMQSESPRTRSNETNAGYVSANELRSISEEPTPTYEINEFNPSSPIMTFEVSLRVGGERKSTRMTCEVRVDKEQRMLHIFDYASDRHRDTFYIPSTHITYERMFKRFCLSQTASESEQHDPTIEMNSDTDYLMLEQILLEMQNCIRPDFLSEIDFVPSDFGPLPSPTVYMREQVHF